MPIGPRRPGRPRVPDEDDHLPGAVTRMGWIAWRLTPRRGDGFKPDIRRLEEFAARMGRDPHAGSSDARERGVLPRDLHAEAQRLGVDISAAAGVRAAVAEARR
ncbi:hypothetical protein D0Z66_20335 (plasmid) [Cereibacter sphaeroides]|nr:hypothetical protein D0Z66_20335 [Cereibacter sphaeroides]